MRSRERRPRQDFESFMGGDSGAAPTEEEVPRGGSQDSGGWVAGDTPTAAPSLDYMLEGKPLTDEPQMPGAYVRIVRTVFRLDAEKAFEDATSKLHFSKRAHLVEYAEIVDALDEASDVATRASQLLQNAKAVAKLYRADVEAMRSSMRAQAVTALQAEKPEKGGKTITDADVIARMAGSFPDEYRRQEELLAKLDGTVAFVTQLVDDWGARRRELEGMMRTSRRV